MSFITSLEDKKWWKAILSFQKLILIITSLVIAVVVSIGVIMRYVFEVNFFGQEELLTLFALWLYWVGGIYGSYEQSQIGADIVISLTKSWKAKKAIQIIIFVISMIVCGFFIAWGIDYTAWSLENNAVSPGLKIPLITSKITMLVGFVFIFLYTLYNLLLTLTRGKDYFEGKEEEK